MRDPHATPTTRARVRHLRPSRALVVCALAVVVFSAVRTKASAPAERYSSPGSGMVLDTKTGLTWQHPPAPTNMTQPAGKTYCAGLNLGGLAWRLPTAKELLTLVDYSQAGGTTPMIDATAFPSSPIGEFYSTTMNGNAVAVDFGSGATNASFPSQEAPEGIRCVH